MPANLGAKLPMESAEARIEIIPLIDIMFFLLASFMLVSLSMVNLKSVKVNLPTATAAVSQSTHDVVDISIDKTGGIFLDTRRIDDGPLAQALAADHRANPDLRVMISGDRDARHGQVIHVLDIVRSAGIDKVAFEIGQAPEGSQP